MKREAVAECRRKLHNEELHDLYAALGITSVIKFVGCEMSGTCGGMFGGEEKCIEDYDWADCRKTTWKRGITGRIVVKWLFSGMGNHGLVHLARDMDK